MKRLWIVCIPILFFLSGCGALPVEEPLPPPVLTVEMPEVSPWRVAPVGRGDIVRYTAFSIHGIQLDYEAAFFSVAGLPIDGIFVSAGDTVNEGDVIARLYQYGLDEELEEVRLELTRLNMNLNQNTALHQHSLNTAGITGVPVDDSAYILQRERLLGEIDLVQSEFNYLSRQDETLNVRAPMTGTVIWVMPFVERQLSTVEAGLAPPVAIVSSQGFSVVRTGPHVTAAYIQIGEIFEITIFQAGAHYDLVAEAIDPYEIGIEVPEDAVPQAYFIVVGGGPLQVFASATGRMVYYWGEALDVIIVPSRVVHYVNGQHFVFVMENGVRRMRYIEVGLADRTYIEVTSGLDVGELVVG